MQPTYLPWIGYFELIYKSEVFVFLEGKAVMEVNGKEYPVSAGDVMIAEPGEDHHVRADDKFPCVNLWLHGSDTAAHLEK